MKRAIVMVGTFLTLACFAMAFATSPARGADAPHPRHDSEHFYARWTEPDAPWVSCCHNEDCAPAISKFENGKWFARWTTQDAWVEIPPHKVDTREDSPDGRAHMCGRRVDPLSSGFTVFCFIAGAGG